MLKLVDGMTADKYSPSFISHNSEPINVMAIGTWDSNTLTVEVNPDPKREASWHTLYQSGAAVTLTSTDNMKALVLPGGVYVRLASASGASTDLDIWVGGPGVALRYAEGITQAAFDAL